ncbi:MAG: tetratricopeptide repeat protein, partial [Bacteroidetes bacterium]|nr:tetratricopeptide repeat protein [Bacteroidota bacterium]
MKKAKCIFFLMFIFQLVIHPGYGTEKDTLPEVYKACNTDTCRVRILLEIANGFAGKKNDKAEAYAIMALDIAKENKLLAEESNVRTTLGMIYGRGGKYRDAITQSLISADIKRTINDLEGLAKTYNNLGTTYYYKGDYDSGIAFHIKSISIKEEIGDSIGMANSYNNIGNIYNETDRIEDARKYYNLSLDVARKIGDISAEARAVSNLGLVFYDMKEFEKAIEFFNKSIDLKLAMNDEKGSSTSLNNLAVVYRDMEENEKALRIFEKVLDIKTKYNDPWGQANTRNNLASCQTKLGNHNGAIKNCSIAYDLADQLGSLPVKRDACQGLFIAYAQSGNFEKAFLNAEEFIILNDSIMNTERDKTIANFREKYETEKKEKEIQLLNKDKELQDAEIKMQQVDLDNKRLQRNGFIIGFIFVGLLVIIAIYAYIQKRKDNRKLAQQRDEITIKNQELEQQKEEISAQRDEIEKQHGIAIIQRDEIQHQKTMITDSISYAQRIQQAILPPIDVIKSVLPGSFVMFQPKDIVSGDFYWVQKVQASNGDDIVVAAAADCTGHGVPGAFMSILCSNILNQAIKERDVSDTGGLMNYLSAEIRRSLRRYSSMEEVKDGMDLTLAAINKQKMVMEYSGVHNPLYIVRDENVMTLKTDDHPLGEPFSEEFPSYTKYHLDLLSGDWLYMLSDGYPDQFGGENR